MAAPQLPLVDDIVAAGVAHLLGTRPSLARHLANPKSGFSKVLAGWRGQAQLLRRRLAKEAFAARLPFATGRELLELAQGRFDIDEAPAARRAIGHVTLERTAVTTAPTDAPFRAGVIQPGTRFARRIDPLAVPALTACAYMSRAPVYATSTADGPPVVDGGAYTYRQTIRVPVEALLDGPDGNILRLVDEPAVPSPIQLADALFDPSFRAIDADAAGGSLGASDDDVRALATAMSSGKHGATASAQIVGALLESGVKRVVVAKDAEFGTSLVYIADESWACSQALRDAVQQRISDAWEGFGCIASLRAVPSRRVSAHLRVRMSAASFLSDTSEVADGVRAVVRSYFDSRPDFWTWRKAAIAADVCAAHPRIQTVETPVVHDHKGVEMSEATEPFPVERTHFYLPPNAVSVEFFA